MKITEKDIKFNKIWLTKDKYIFRMKLGGHWYLKKFLVLYKFFLVDRTEINEAVLLEISQNFKNFVDSIYDPIVRKDAERYFFNPIDLRKFKNILNFEKFNDVEDSDITARKYFIMYVMGIGAQSGINKIIMGKLCEKNITLSEIIDSIPEETNRLKKDAKKNGKKPAVKLDDKVNQIISDFHAEIRNYRQLLSFRGIVPQGVERYELNEISKLICSADSILIMAIWEHQKLKLRYNNPYTRETKTDNIKKYTNISDFEDFKVNPYIALIQVLNELYKKKSDDAYITFEDYKFFICREYPFKLKNVLKKIIGFRGLNQADQENISAVFDQRPKTREFSMDKPKSSSEDFLKELANLIYGVYEYDYSSNHQNFANILEYNDQRLSIKQKKLFEIFGNYIDDIQDYLSIEYKEKYERFSNYNSLKLIDEIFPSSTNEKDRTLLKSIRQNYLKRHGDDLDDFYQSVYKSWEKYIQEIDYKLLLFVFASNLTINYYDKIKDDMKIPEFVKNVISIEIINITGIEKEKLIHILCDIIKKIKEKKSFFKIIDERKLIEKTDFLKDADAWVDGELEINSISTMKQMLKRRKANSLYTISEKGHERIRDYKMMKLVQRERMRDKIIMGTIRKNYLITKCDICENEFVKGEPQCHHIIPFEMFGPDVELNYVFLCDSCHKVFTHNHYSEKAKENIIKLKMKGLIKRRNFEKMIYDSDLHDSHLDYLYKVGYIHTVDRMELRKMIKEKISGEKEEDFVTKTMPSGNRWPRAMYEVFRVRQKLKRVMEKVCDEFDVDVCDGCGNKFKYAEQEPECHHIIPKNQEPGDGPESPYNYAYLCKICHDKFTRRREERFEVIEQLKKKKLVTFGTIKQMILHEEILEKHLVYLKDEKYIDQDEFSTLISLSRQMLC